MIIILNFTFCKGINFVKMICPKDNDSHFQQFWRITVKSMYAVYVFVFL